ncbi:MAG: hypothetical protein RIS45_1534 [Planctomycetota bacterium]
MSAYRVPAERERVIVPAPTLSPWRAFRFGVRMRPWPRLLAAPFIAALISTPVRYRLGWREYDLRVAVLNAITLALVMFLIEMVRGYRRALCVRAGIRKGAAK